MQLFHFTQMVNEASKAIYFGLSSKGSKWVGEIVKQGENWDQTLQELLQDQQSEFKSHYYEKLFLTSNKENADFLMRVAHRLC